ncbi:hypothetical protein HPP92_008128 [Vanilla planifolia]|uniref:SPARK domain-containing protein n=1 Tax=Vanilla planifolia TaxID=51239 RepID=A0A835RGN8_VANPL|nr:hypothetical protein HPP92_008128 [Vanilla planifolia]
MPRISPSLLLVHLLASHIFLLSALPRLHTPDPNPIMPTVDLPIATPPSTITALPEQAVAASGAAACPLDLSEDLIPVVSSACSPHHLRSRPAFHSHCCSTLAAGLYSAYAATALSAPALSAPASHVDQPLLPDDSEACAAVAERTITAHGVELPRVNATCDTAYCYCGIRLRRLSCPGVAAALQGQWTPPEEWARRLERDCTRPGVAGCSVCLRTLNQIRIADGNTTMKNRKEGRSHDNDCQLMGLTWLLSRNRTRYLQTVTAVLRAFMAVNDSAAASSDRKGGNISCYVSHNEMPMAVGSSEVDGHGDLSAAKELQSVILLSAYSLLVYFFHGLVVI